MNIMLFGTINLDFVEGLLFRIPQELDLLIVGLVLASAAAILRYLLRSRKEVASVGHETE